MDISNFFDKKRDLSDQSNQSDFVKKVRQAVALQIHLSTYSKKVWNILTEWKSC